MSVNVSGWVYNINMKQAVKVHKVANTAYIVGMREIRKSNASGVHDNRPNRLRTRKAVKNHSIKEYQ